MKLPADPAPALSRGLVLLALLDRSGPARLEDLATSARLPKPSVLRLLRTLQTAGAADREPGGKRWRALARLVPTADIATTLRARAAAALDHLCLRSGHIAELYALEDRGLRMIDRREPAGCAVTLRAQIGFLRDWNEAEAVAQLGLAFGAAPVTRHWAYRDGKPARLAVTALRRKLSRVRDERVAVDFEANVHGVRRIAVPIVDSQRRLSGALAIAAIGADASAEHLPRLKALVQHTAPLE
jgi:DNA-binding IclR family transcriptional regulator